MGAGVVKPRPDGRPGFQIHIHNSNINIGPNGPNSSQARTFSTTTTTTTSSQGQASATSTSRQSAAGNSPKADPRATPETMSCEECTVAFTVFKRKKACKDCGRLFCSACTVQLASGRNSPFTTKEVQCKKCQIILAGNFKRTQLLNWKIKDLKAPLNKRNVNTTKCKEKNDLIDLLFHYYGTPQNLERIGTEHERFVEEMAVRMREERSSSTPVAPNATDQPNDPGPTTAEPSVSGANTASQQTSTGDPQDGQTQEMREMEARLLEQELEEEENQESQPANPHLRLADIQSEEEIESLTIKSLKRLLLNNFVDYKGCCERWELQQRVKRLWADKKANALKDPDGTEETDIDLCKICMDATIDCVLLECGHMVTCTECGKQLSECPICRQYVVRAVHTFRS